MFVYLFERVMIFEQIVWFGIHIAIRNMEDTCCTDPNWIENDEDSPSNRSQKPYQYDKIY